MKLKLNLMPYAIGFLVDTEVSKRSACSYFGVLCVWCVGMEFELVVQVIKNVCRRVGDKCCVISVFRVNFKTKLCVQLQ